MELDTFILDLFSMRIVYVMATHRSPVSTASEHVLWGHTFLLRIKTQYSQSKCVNIFPS